MEPSFATMNGGSPRPLRPTSLGLARRLAGWEDERMAGLLLSTKGMKSFGRYGSVGFELLASIGVGYYLGHWIDGKLGTRWIALIGFILGCYAGFRALFRTAKMMQRDAEREDQLARGEDPWAPPARDSDAHELADGEGREPSKPPSDDPKASVPKGSASS